MTPILRVWADETRWRRVAATWAVVLGVVFALLAAAATAGALRLSDQVLLAMAQRSAAAPLDTAMVVVSTLGSVEVTYALMVALVLTNRRIEGDSRLSIWIPLLVLVSANLVELGAKMVIPQAAPVIVLHRGADPSFGGFVSTPFSFPSGHMVRATIVFGVLALRLVGHSGRMIWLVLLIGLIWMIGLSRVYLGTHWPSDVAGGILLGGIGLSFCLVLAPRATIGRVRQTAST